MALKPDRKINDGVDISFFMNTVAERGVAVVLSTAGSGAAMDDSAAVVSLPTVAYGSGQTPIGLLLCDVVSGDLTKTHLNQHKDEVQVGGKVTILRRGTVVTNMIEGTPAGGQGAFISSVGTDGKLCGMALATSTAYNVATGINVGANTTGVYVAMTLAAHGGVSAHNPALTKIGLWLGSKDADGYAKLDVNLI